MINPYTLHQKQQLLICHHCGSQKRIPPQCPNCGSVRIAPLGQGTEQLEYRLEELFPDSGIVRIDRDSTRKKGELTKLLQEISRQKTPATSGYTNVGQRAITFQM